MFWRKKKKDPTEWRNTLPAEYPPKSVFYSYFGKTTDEMIDKAHTYMEEHPRASIPAMVYDEMEHNTDPEDGKSILELYAAATPEEKAKYDYLMVCLCGWTLGSVLEHMEELPH